MKSTLLAFAIVVVAATAVSYEWDPSCRGDLYYSSSLSSCFSPAGFPTLADSITFPRGTSVVFGATINYSPYYPIMAQDVRIDAGAQVTLVNGMIAVQGNVYVNGTLSLNSANTGVGPWDDGYNRPLPDYQLPGFTPNIIGHNAHFGTPTPSNVGEQSKVIVSGTLNVNGGYAAVFTDMDILVPGVVKSGTGTFFGVIHNFGEFHCDALYMGGTLVNEVSGVMGIGGQLNSPFSDGVWPTIVNHGHTDYGWGAEDDLPIHLINTGTFAFVEVEGKTRPHGGTDRLGERVVRGRLVNKKGAVLRFASRRIRSDRYNVTAELLNEGLLEAEDAGMRFARDVANAGAMRLESRHPQQDEFVFAGHLVNDGQVSVGRAAVTFGGDVRNGGLLRFANRHVSVRGALTNAHDLDAECDHLGVAGPVVNSGRLSIRNADARFGASFDNSGDATLRNRHTEITGDVFNNGTMAVHDEHAVFRGRVHNTRALRFDAGHVELQGDVTNTDDMAIGAARGVEAGRELRNSGRMHVAAPQATFEGDVLNVGAAELTLEAGHSTLKADLYNEGHFAAVHPTARHSLCFVEGRTYNTGNVTLRNAHLTVTSMISHGENTVSLETHATTLTLGTWGTNLRRGVARGYLRREKADACPASPEPLAEPQPAAQGADCVGMVSCDMCCPESALCVVYVENVYCGGYLESDETFLPPHRPQHDAPEYYVLTPLATARMPARMKQLMGEVRFNHPHVVAGHMTLSGPGAVTTTDTLEVHGALLVEDGAELFSMVEHDRAFVAGTGHVTVRRCGKWLLGNDAHQHGHPYPNITVGDGGALVVPRHAKVVFGSGFVHLSRDAKVHVDGHLETGADFAWHSPEGRRVPRIGGSGRFPA
jgi:hypothetical protein